MSSITLVCPAVRVSDNATAHVYEHLKKKVTDDEYVLLMDEKGFKDGPHRAPSFWPDGTPFDSKRLSDSLPDGQRVFTFVHAKCAEMLFEMEMQVYALGSA